MIRNYDLKFKGDGFIIFYPILSLHYLLYQQGIPGLDKFYHIFLIAEFETLRQILVHFPLQL
jgi:hypothetical protein